MLQQQQVQSPVLVLTTSTTRLSSPFCFKLLAIIRRTHEGRTEIGGFRVRKRSALFFPPSREEQTNPHLILIIVSFFCVAFSYFLIAYRVREHYIEKTRSLTIDGRNKVFFIHFVNPFLFVT